MEKELSQQAKIFSIKRLVPQELEADMNRLNNLETFDKVKAYIVEQVLVKRDAKNQNTGPVSMDLDYVQKMLANLGEKNCEWENWDKKDEKEEKKEDADALECQECEPNLSNPLMEILSMVKGKGIFGKGKGKGKNNQKFDGYCDFCGKYGHKKSDCWSKEQQGKGKGQHKGKYSSWGKGWQNSKGKGKGLNLWDFTIASANNATPSRNSRWTLKLTKTRLSPPPGLTKKYDGKNTFEILRLQDLENNDEMPELDKCTQTNVPSIDEGTKKRQKARMPKMPNYSKNGMKKLDMQKSSETKSGMQVNVLMKAIPSIPKNLNNFEANKMEETGWLRLKGVMDSGASESVAPPDLAPQYPITSSPGSLAGQEYVSASNDSIPNLGEKLLEIVTEDGREKTIKYQIAEVSRPLNSISEICDAGGEHGQVLVFGRSGGAIYNLETGEHTPFNQEDGVYCMDVWVEPKGFPRQGW